VTFVIVMPTHSPTPGQAASVVPLNPVRIRTNPEAQVSSGSPA
jgi:hypothetical protein